MQALNRKLLESFPWHETPLGPQETWPVEMRSVVQTIMASEFPVCTGWGDDLVQIYNDGYNHIFGGKHPASFGAPLRQSWPEIWPFVEEALDEVRQTGEPLMFRGTMLPLIKDGDVEECYFDFSYSAIKALNGKVIGMMSIATETTDMVIARRRQSIFHIEAAANAETGIAAFSESLRGVLQENHMDCRAAVLFRLSPENGIPTTTDWSLRVDATFINAVRPIVAAAISDPGNGTVNLPTRILQVEMASKACVVPVADSQGKLIAALLIVPDRLVPVTRSLLPFAAQISQRLHSVLHATELRNKEVQRAQEKMAEQSAMYRFLFENMRDGAIYTATGGKPQDDEVILAINGWASDMLGYAPQEAVGMRRDSFFFDEDPALDVALHERSDSGHFVGDLSFRRKDGQAVPVEVTSNIFELNGGDTRSLTIIRDISARNARDREREERMRNEVIASLTRAVAHDFNNMLFVILGSLEVLRERLDDDASRKLADNALRAAEEAGCLTSQLLTYSRREPVKPRLLEIAAFLQEIRPLLVSAIGESNTLKYELGGGRFYCLADSSALTTGLINLATNARDAMFRDGALSISVRTVATDQLPASHDGYPLTQRQYLVLTVRDTGGGIPESLWAKAFEPFFTTKDIGDGTGLGLPSVLSAMRQMGGDLRLARPGSLGAEFQIVLPVADNANFEKASNTADTLMNGKADGEIVLYVEDNALVRKQTIAMLRQLGFSPLVARHGREALEHARRETRIDIVLTDIVMPGGLSGRALARELAHIRPGLPVVMTTGYGPDSLAGAPDKEASLRKPYSCDELGKALFQKL